MSQLGKKGAINRKFWLAWIPMSFCGLIVIFIALNLLINFQIQKQDTQLNATLKQVDDHIYEHFSSVIDDLEFLVNNPVTDDFIDYPDSVVELALLKSMFLRMAESHSDYVQIRLLSKEGMELVRINNDDGVASSVSKNHLQDKSDRYYYKEALGLKQGELYISRIDLNIEDGHLEIPHNPMVRFIAPVVNFDRETVAFMLINMKGETVLHHLHKILSSDEGTHLVLNKDGFVFHASDEKESLWGFALGSEDSFAKRHPEILNKIQKSDFGQFDSDIGRVNYRIVNKEISSRVDSSPLSIKPWIVIFVTDTSLLNLNFLKEHFMYLYPLLLVFPVGTVLVYVWAKASVGRERAEQQLKLINEYLEKKVESRTQELELTREATVLSLATLAETRDNETGQHIKRTQRYVKILAEELQASTEFCNLIDDNFVDELYRSAPLHDIGKVGIPDHILLKPEPLTEDEILEMQKHTELGSNALQEAILTISGKSGSSGAMTFLHVARDIAHYHHERWDGNGYPKGLKEEEIPLCARIMAIADVYDALVSKRAYKEAFSKAKTERIMIEESKGQFDPRILEAFVSVKDQFWEIRRNFADEFEV